MKKLEQLFFILLIQIAVACSYDKGLRLETLDTWGFFVDPMIGTDAHGHTFPGAVRPFGMVQLSPDNPVSGWDWSSGYHYSSNIIAGFSHTHLSGTGVGDMLDISFLPIAGNFSPESFREPSQYYATFGHDEEWAEPGYYEVKLSNGIKAAFTVTDRCGYHMYEYPAHGVAQLMLDLAFHQNRDKPLATWIRQVSANRIEGYRYSTGWAEHQWVYFSAEFSREINNFYLVDGSNHVYSGQRELTVEGIEGIGAKAIMDFGSLNEPLFVKVGISSVDTDGARNNLDIEIGNHSFVSVREEASEAWEAVLAKIQVKSQDTALLKTFYTALYHACIAPSLHSDADGRYRGADQKIHLAEGYRQYSTFSLWDTFRAAHPLYTIIQQQRVPDFVQSLLSHYRQTGLLPVWPLWANETNTMIGYHAVPVLLDAYIKNLAGDANPEEIFEAMKKSAYQQIRNSPLYREYGYIPFDKAKNSVSTTLEYAYDDWCIAQMALLLGKEGEYQHFMDRSMAYKHLLHPDTKLMQPKDSKGQWKEPFDPFDASYENDYTEGNAWQFTWYVPHDIEGLMQEMGGREIFTKMLDSLFVLPQDVGEDAALDVSGFIGQYIHGNEPSHHIAYLYNHSGQRWKTQKTVNQIIREMYNDSPAGLSGNEDCGQMSAWFVFTAMGMYPVNPASGSYELGKPFFPYIELDLPKGNKFIIHAQDLSEDNIYVQNILLNGKTYGNSYIIHDQLLNGGMIEYYMGSEPVAP
jgi:predicted alpha-1,2-mannosidase